MKTDKNWIFLVISSPISKIKIKKKSFCLKVYFETKLEKKTSTQGEKQQNISLFSPKNQNYIFHEFLATDAPSHLAIYLMT